MHFCIKRGIRRIDHKCCIDWRGASPNVPLQEIESLAPHQSYMNVVLSSIYTKLGELYWMCRIWDEVRSDSGCCYILRYTKEGRTVFVQNFWRYILWSKWIRQSVESKETNSAPKSLGLNPVRTRLLVLRPSRGNLFLWCNFAIFKGVWSIWGIG